MTTVGPYARYGLPLVEACARAGTHYADLTGEVLFVREAIDRSTPLARETGARIVHACGYDSVPSDLAVLLLHERAAADGAGGLRDVRLVATARGGLSGGTIDSIRAQVDTMRRDPAARRLAADPVRAEPGPRRGAGRPAAARRRSPRADDGRPLDRAVRHGGVQHADRAPQQCAAGLRLRPRAAVRGGDGHRARAARGGGCGRRSPAGCSRSSAAMAVPPTRALLDRVLPAPGTGPSATPARAGGSAWSSTRRPRAAAATTPRSRAAATRATPPRR